MSDDQAAANDRLATKIIRADINRVLVRWDPLALRGLAGADRAYEEYLNELLIMVKKGRDKMEIARHLAALMRDQWGLPEDNARCVDIAGKLHGIGARYRGEE